MKKPKRKKPKFRVDQVVCLPQEDKPLFSMHRLHWVEGIEDSPTGLERDRLYRLDGIAWLVAQSELRPLTAKEIGPR